MLNEEQMLTPSFFFLFWMTIIIARGAFGSSNMSKTTHDKYDFDKITRGNQNQEEEKFKHSKKYLFLKLSFRTQIKHAEKLCSQLQSS